MRFTPQDEQFRAGVREWLEANLTGEFAGLRGAGGPGREHERHDERLAWNRHLAAAGWTCLGWPAEHGGRGASLIQQVIFYEEYARADAPARVSIVGEELLGPTLIAFGTPEQQRALPAADPGRPRAVVPGLLRTRRRLRPGRRGHPGGRRGRDGGGALGAEEWVR